MRETIDAAVELQILGLEMAVVTLNQVELSEEAANAAHVCARIHEGIESILDLLSKQAKTAEQQMRIDALVSHLRTRLDELADMTSAQRGEHRENAERYPRDPL